MSLGEHYIGIDGCKAGWFYVGITDQNRFEFGVVGHFDEISPIADRAKLVLVDIPIGLFREGRRERLCDTEARRAISPRGSTVFPAPSRRALLQSSYTAASEANFRATGRKLSRQSWAIAPRIAEVDEFVRRQGKSARIREMHPEVAFWALHRKRPLLTSKKKTEGAEERLRILSRHFGQARACYEEARSSFNRSQVATDDILDAMAGAVTARYSERLKTLPPTPEKDEFGLPMEIVYADLPCIFCSAPPEQIFLERELVRCLWDTYPLSPGHALITPKRHVVTWFEATMEEKAAIVEVLDDARKIIESRHKPTAYNIGVNSGRDAGQTIPHLHLHVIPRYPGDTGDPRGGIRNILPAKARYWERK